MEARGGGEAYWRKEAGRIREKLRAMTEQREALRAQIAEQESGADSFQRRRRSSSASSSTSVRALKARLAALERRMHDTEDDLLDRARRAGALPGWLR